MSNNIEVNPKPKKKGRPKLVPMDLAPRDRPESYPSLIRYLEAKGKVKHTSKIQMMHARHKYLQGASADAIAQGLNIETHVVERWALIFGWDEERDTRLFNSFRKFSTIEGKYGANLADRHDRIAGSIEQVAERLLHQHQSGKIMLDTKDLATIAATVRATQEIRRTARGQKDIKQETKDININVNMPQAFENVAAAMADAYSVPKLPIRKSKQIAVEIGDAIGTDAEYEATDQ